MVASSHSPGCIRLWPDSQSCTVRRPECISTPKAVWVSPAASLRARIDSGGGLALLECLERLGWLGICLEQTTLAHHRFGDVIALIVARGGSGWGQIKLLAISQAPAAICAGVAKRLRLH